MTLMSVVRARPPLWDEIRAAFPMASDTGVIFAWGDRIYNPSGGVIEPALFVHESVHGARQGSDVEGWWRKYIADPQFRLDEEIPAHVAELRVRVRGASRQKRRHATVTVARRLASPLYGRLLPLEAAKELLKAAI